MEMKIMQISIFFLTINCCDMLVHKIVEELIKYCYLGYIKYSHNNTNSLVTLIITGARSKCCPLNQEKQL